MYTPLPANLLEHVIPSLYFPYFGQLANATHATFAINCGPPEANFDSLGTHGKGWNVTMSKEETDHRIHSPFLTLRPAYYFRHGQNHVPDGLGHPRPNGFWSFFNCAGAPNENPVHRQHYFEGSLFHIDGIPWATKKRWSKVSNDTKEAFTNASGSVLGQVLDQAIKLEKIFVRGRSAANFLAAQIPELTLDWNLAVGVGRYRLVSGQFFVKQRKIEVRAVNHFQNITHEAAQALLHLRL